MHVLAGLKVLELEGLAPTVFCGQLLADYGAQVTVIERPSSGTQFLVPRLGHNYLHRNKQALVLDLKTRQHRQVFRQMAEQADVLVDCYPPGRLETFLDLSQLFKANPGLVLCRISGFGQTGAGAGRAGHDLNYLARSGVLSQFSGSQPVFPANLLGDMCGGALLGVVGILLLLHQRTSTGRGGTVDQAMTQGTSYIGSFIHMMQQQSRWNAPRGHNLLDGGSPFYRLYTTRDSRFLSVAALEPKFFKAFLTHLDLSSEQNQAFIKGQYERSIWPEMEEVFRSVIQSKDLSEWTALFSQDDQCCVEPVLGFDQLSLSKEHPQIPASPRLTDSEGKEFLHKSPPVQPNSQKDHKQVLNQYGIDHNLYFNSRL